MSVIVALSGGMSSAWCAGWAMRNYSPETIILYFNDTKWEHRDLYRFLGDIEVLHNKKIVHDNDGRNPEEVFSDENFLGNNRVPICSRILKAERLQKYYQPGDTLVFGIGQHEANRANRIIQVYANLKKPCLLRFPLIEEKVTTAQIKDYLKVNSIKIPELYALGFEHNNCSGGCIRAGKKQWAHLLRVLPEVYKQREDFEESFRELNGKDVHFLKDTTLKHLREIIEMQPWMVFEEGETGSECIGICTTLA